MRISRTVLILIVVVCAAPSFGQTPFLVRDLNTTHASYSSSTPSSFVDLDGKIVFFAKTPASGREPWVVSGGIATPLRDVKPGVGDSLVPWFPLVSLGNGQALFAAYNPYGWTELWRTDGTPDGTARVKDIYPGGNADLSFPTVINGKAYFTANDGTNGSEPWVSDGTADGTFMLANLDGAASSSTVYGFISVGNRIFIFADGRLWIVDGSVFQVPVTIESSGGFIAAGNTVYMSAWTEDTGRELWKTDGTAAGTQLVRDIRPGPESSFSTFLLSSGTNAVFLATDDGSTWDLWKSDGTPEGTQVVKSNLAASSPRHLATVTGLSFFLANGATWRTDGTAEGTFPLFTGTSVSFVRAFDRMIFLRPVGAGWEIWTTDGTVAGTSRLLQRSVVGSNTSAFASAGGKLYFASETLLDGTEPWICEDGTDAGTRLLANIGPDSPGSSIPENLIAAKQFLYFRAHAGGATTELWRTDGTSSGTIQLTALGENGNSPWISLMTAWQGTLWFRHGATDLWRSNGDVAGTQPWSNPPTVDRLSPTSSLLFLEDHDARVWRTDGTQDGTRFLLTPQLMRDDPGGPAVEVAGRVYLSGSSLIPGLFRTDGTAESTKRILTFDTNELQSPYFAAAGALYFALRQTATGTELWRTDGTFEGTNLVKDISPGGSSSSPGAFAEMGPYLFFTADDGTHGRELWRSDGTGTGTILLRDIFAGTASAEIANATRVGNILYFTANDGSSGNELWRSDGTPEGTLRVMDLNPGSASSSPRDLVEAQGSLFFAAGDGLHGEELWQTTGVDSVMMVTDLEPGPSSSSPAEMTQAGSLLYFAATSSAGRELWALPLASSSLSISDARVAEGAPGTTRIARFVVTRDGSTSSSASASFTTNHGSASTGSDFVSAGGIVSFAPGQTDAFIDVIVNGDADIENHEVFHVTLSNPTNVAISRATGTAVIEDDDHRAELSMEWLPASDESQRVLRITNHGPSAATDIVFRYRESPYKLDAYLVAPVCYDLLNVPCTLDPLPAGESIDLTVRVAGSDGYPQFVDPNDPPGRTIHAAINSAEADSNATDNDVAVMISDDATLQLPSFITAGTSASANVWRRASSAFDERVVLLQTSSTNLAASPSTVVIPTGQQTAPFSLIAGSASGVVRLTAGGNGYSAPRSMRVPVVAPGVAPKLDVAFYAPSAQINVGETAELHVEVAARRFDDVLPTGSIQLLDFDSTIVVAEHILAAGATTFVLSGLAPGKHSYRLHYAGDGIFNPLTAGRIDVNVANWATQTTMVVKPVICGNATIEVRVRNKTAPTTPAGSVVLRIGSPAGTTIVATVPLSPGSTAGVAVATYTRSFDIGEDSIGAEYVPAGTFTSSATSLTLWSTVCNVAGMTATALSSESVLIAWTPNGAHHYDVMRATNRSAVEFAGTTTGTAWTDGAIPPNRIQVYFVCGRSVTNALLGCSQPDLASTMMFTDDPVTPHGSIVRSTHFLELQSLFNGYNVWSGSPAFTEIALFKPVLAVHVNELRAAVNAFRGAYGLLPVNFTDAIVPGTIIRATHLQQIRDAVK